MTKLMMLGLVMLSSLSAYSMEVTHTYTFKGGFRKGSLINDTSDKIHSIHCMGANNFLTIRASDPDSRKIELESMAECIYLKDLLIESGPSRPVELETTDSETEIVKIKVSK